MNMLEIQPRVERNEQIGIPPSMRERCDAAVAGPMAGEYLIVNRLVVHDHRPDLASLQDNVGLLGRICFMVAPGFSYRSVRAKQFDQLLVVHALGVEQRRPALGRLGIHIGASSYEYFRDGLMSIS